MKQLISAAAIAAALALAGAAHAQPAAGGGAVREACGADMQKVCPDAKPGPGGGMRECMKAHWDQLSDGCKAAIGQMRGKQAGSAAKPNP